MQTHTHTHTHTELCDNRIFKVLLRIKKSFKPIDFDLANFCRKLCKNFLSTVNNNNNNKHNNKHNNNNNNNLFKHY